MLHWLRRMPWRNAARRSCVKTGICPVFPLLISRTGFGIRVSIGHFGSCMDLGLFAKPAADCSSTTSIFAKKYTIIRPHRQHQTCYPYPAHECRTTPSCMLLAKLGAVRAGGICLVCIDLCVTAAAVHRSALMHCPKTLGKPSVVYFGGGRWTATIPLFKRRLCIAYRASEIALQRNGHLSVLLGRGTTKAPLVWSQEMARVCWNWQRMSAVP